MHEGDPTRDHLSFLRRAAELRNKVFLVFIYSELTLILKADWLKAVTLYDVTDYIYYSVVIYVGVRRLARHT